MYQYQHAILNNTLISNSKHYSLCCFLCLLITSQVCSAEVDFKLSNSVVKVVVKTQEGKSQLGSGVVVANNKVATNCHVTRSATSAFLLKAGRRYKVLAQSSLAELDICILETAPLELPVAKLGKSNALKIGEPMIMFGYPLALGIRLLQGSITALHAHKNNYVIEVNTGFIQGASGGGVFNQKGKLIGLATFMTRDKDNMHFFAIPAAWVEIALKLPFAPIQPFKETSFWEKGNFQYQHLAE